MTCVGIDGCKGGWVAVSYFRNQWQIALHDNIDKITDFLLEPDIVLIDMPMGLSSSDFTRDIDKQLRKLLKKKSGSVFTPACREALYKTTYEQAKEINKQITGKSLSIQAYNISKKIRELDTFLSQLPKIDHFFEAHPELCFQMLNYSETILDSKKTRKGIEERIEIIKAHAPELLIQVEAFMKNTRRVQVLLDDVLDACALCLQGLKRKGKLKLIWNSDIKYDVKGIPVRVGY